MFARFCRIAAEFSTPKILFVFNDKFSARALKNAYSNLNPQGSYTVNLQIKNTGPATATFDPATVLLNGQKVSSITGASATFSQTTLVTNASATRIITLPSTGFTSGIAVKITILDTRHGLQFSQVVTLP